MLNRLWICLNSSAKVSCTMSCFPSQSHWECCVWPFLWKQKIEKNKKGRAASLPVETRHRGRRDGVHSGFGCSLQHGACPECTPWAGHWKVLPRPRRKMQQSAPCHRCTSPERSAECYMPKAFWFPHQRCTYIKWRGNSHEHYFTDKYKLN